MSFEEIIHLPGEILKYLSIPIFAGFIGWFTNWIAIKMTFYPIYFWGYKKLKIGWQGIIPANAAKISNKSVDLITQKLISLEEIFERLYVDDITRIITPHINKSTEKVLDNVMKKHYPSLWNNLPKVIKDNIYKRISKDLPITTTSMMQEMKGNISHYIDIKKMCVDAILKDISLLNDIFLKCGKEEFKFIVNSGWWFGLVFGIFQMLAWYLYPANWTLPVCGIIVGYATNWLALKLIFEPKKPKKFFGYEVHALFIKRQKEVATEYAKIVSEKILNSEQMWEHMLNENNGEKIWQLIHKHVEEGLEKQTATNESVLQLVIGGDKYEAIKSNLIQQLVAELPKSIHHMHETTNAAFDIETMMREKMTALSPEEFEGVLRPAFQEEEFTLILVGAVLGGLAGLVQLMIVFDGGN